MSYKSYISILNIDNTVESVYCHAQSNLAENGVMLFFNYNNLDKVKKLISLGPIYHLDKNIDLPPNQYHGSTPLGSVEGVSIFYERDNIALLSSHPHLSYANINAWQNSRVFEPDDYMFVEKQNCWYAMSGTHPRKLRKISHLLLSSPRIDSTTKEAVAHELEVRRILSEAPLLEKSVPKVLSSPINLIANQNSIHKV